jgi:membrane protease YdiL (CAAX protease family)
MNQLPDKQYATAFALLIGLMGVCMITSGGLALALSDYFIKTPKLSLPEALLRPEYVNLNRLLNTVIAFFSFFVPAFVVAKKYNTKPFAQLGFNKNLSIKQVGLVVIITVGALFLSGALANINEQIPVSGEFRKTATAWENSYKQSILSIATMKNIGDYFISLIVIALLPAFVEEVFFRGSLQPILIGWFRNVHIGIIFSAVIFSAIHGSYFGFLPRIGLGLVLSIVFYQSKNLWLSILLHFINNAIAVTQIYWLTQNGTSLEKAMDEATPLWMGFIGLIIIPAFYFFQQESNRILANRSGQETIDNSQ